MHRSVSFGLFAAGAILSVGACTAANTVSVGNAGTPLQAPNDGQASTPGVRCVWGTGEYDEWIGDARTMGTNTDAGITSPAVATYVVGDAVKSPDGCSDCSCTASGIACGASTCADGRGGPPMDPAIECASSARMASAWALAAIGASKACTTDTDCTSVAVRASCFDYCSTAVNTAGLGSVSDELSSAETKCARFNDLGCTLEVPSCAPSEVPHCKSGSCVLE